MNELLQNFQFIRPGWLWASLALIIIYVLKIKFGKNQNVWQEVIPAHLYQQMIVRKGLNISNKFIHLSAASLLLAIIAIAGPSWEKLPQAVYQTQAGKVILMDMSMSMRATDLSPNRLTRARFKAIDLVNEVKEGETGLVAYAGDAFVVSPLTDDVNNLISLLPVLTPEIMPIKGSVALNGLTQASTLLENAGYQQGQIYWVTDGIRYDEIKEVREFIKRSPFDVSALLIGTEVGAPIAMQDGQLLKDFTGKIVVPSINSRYMNQAMAGTSAQFHLFADDNSDIQAMKRKIDLDQQQQSKEIENTMGDTFKDMGPYLLLLLLPVAAYSFRKGVLSIALFGSFVMVLSSNSPNAYAIQTDTLANEPSSPAQNLSTSPVDGQAQSAGGISRFQQIFKNADQRGKAAFDANNYEAAQNLFDDLSWQAASAYKGGDYELAEALYSELAQGLSSQDESLADTLYNKGNALAKQGKLEEALLSYQQVLNNNPEHEQASANKQLVEDLIEQQEDKEQDEQQQDGQSSDDSGDQNEQQGDSQEQQDESQNGEQKSEEQSGEQQSSQDKDSEQNATEQQNDEALKQEAQNAKDEQEAKDAQSQSQQDPSQQQKTQDEEGSEQAQQGDEATSQKEQEQTSAISNQVNMDDLTPEQKEELQRMQMILNKIPDDPAYLLKRKMQLEAYKRKNNPSPPEQENW